MFPSPSTLRQLFHFQFIASHFISERSVKKQLDNNRKRNRPGVCVGIERQGQQAYSRCVCVYKVLVYYKPQVIYYVMHGEQLQPL